MMHAKAPKYLGNMRERPQPQKKRKWEKSFWKREKLFCNDSTKHASIIEWCMGVKGFHQTTKKPSAAPCNQSSIKLLFPVTCLQR
jgi:hypothetical protein